MRFSDVARTHVGLKRRLNEDAMLCRADLGLWAVADGMGGHDAGEVASAAVTDHLAALAPAVSLVDRRLAVHQALEQANQALLAKAEARATGTIGSTVVALAADGQAFVCLWAGDSRAYRLRGDVIAQLTKDHSLVQELVDLGELEPAKAQDHPNSNIITRAIGVRAQLGVDCVEGDVASGDVFLLASDGLTRLVSEAELSAALRASDLSRAADHLVGLCLARGAPDNISLVIIKAE